MGRSKDSEQLSEAEASLRASEAGWGVTIRYFLITAARNKWLAIPSATAVAALAFVQAMFP